MKNITYYLKHYGNKSFIELPFNEIDSLILCQIGYLHLDLYSKSSDDKVYLKDIMISDNAFKLSEGIFFSKENQRLVKAFEHTKRYKDVYFKHAFHRIDDDSIAQFFAVTFFIDDFIQVSFRGTDLSITGWQEDFNMLFLQEIPAQRYAVEYLNSIYELYKEPMIVAGHSKGGNLAVYSSFNADDDVRDHIFYIYNFDGPGFNNNSIYRKDEFVKIKDKLVTMGTSSSIISMLMYNVDNIEFLKTSAVGWLQHNVFSWNIDNEYQLKRIRKNAFTSQVVNRAVKEFLSKTSQIDLEEFVDIIFYIAKEEPRSSLLDIKRHPFRYLYGMITRGSLLTRAEKDFYNKMIKSLRICYQNAIRDIIKEQVTKKS